MPTSDSDDTGAVGEGDLPDAVVEDILSSPRRERMVSHLADRSAPMVLDDLMAHVLAEERDTTPTAISKADRKEARTEAYETHLPKLTAVDAVRYDSLVGTVELTDDRLAARVDP